MSIGAMLLSHNDEQENTDCSENNEESPGPLEEDDQLPHSNEDEMILLDDNNVDQPAETTSDVGTYYNTIRGGIIGKNIVECSLMMLLGQFRVPRYSYEAIVR